ncbi:hypothetical protein [uncultured Sunxiuqinia sp.]|jgi:Cu/Ag efflux protein CusF|uniref:hypothetical protein n=1 Tax=uncultured Sunxiuqinia sp. TaxID=1573825 RepID=UPI0030DB0A51|tara:strand:- start:22934 stop:23266 length:333 start_codon:yes stop_codon:yes gene_type:complete
MKKTIFFVFVLILAFSAAPVLANSAEENSTSESDATKAKMENKLSDEEVKKLVERIEEIREIDKSEMTSKEKRVLRKEVKEIKETVKKHNGTIYIGGSTLLIIILLIILL